MRPRTQTIPEPRARSRAQCVVCGASAGRSLCGKRGYRLMLCECGGVYLSPTPAIDAVDCTDDAHPPSFYALPCARKLRWLAKHRATGDLLEIGCGDGHFLAAAKQQGYRVRGIEAHPERASRVAEQLGIPVENALLEHSNTPDGCADIVYHCDLLSHFPDPVDALGRMGRLLRPGGLLFFEVGLHGDISPFWYRQMPENSVPRHRWFFDSQALDRLLHRAGFRIVSTKRFGLAQQVLFYHTAGPLVRMLRWLRRSLHGRTARETSANTLATTRESALEARVNNFLRFRLGAVMPGIGPQTCFVIARPEVDA